LITYLLIGLVTLLILGLVWSLTSNPNLKQSEKVMDLLLNQNRELLNRLQAPDLKTFLALQSDSKPSPESEYIPRDDESEAERLAKTFRSESFNPGYGEVLTDEDIRAYSLDDFREFNPGFREAE
jgi:hypothetical protein